MQMTMRKYRAGLLLTGLLLLTGCIMSGTFVIVESISFSAHNGFYFHQVDVTHTSTWEDHKDDIDFIDAVGAEFYITSNETGPVTFDVYVDDYSGPGANPSSVPSTATKVIDALTVDPGVSKIDYAKSLEFITGLDRLKALAKVGQFDYYATSTGSEGTTFVVDSGKVIITLSAGE